MIYSSQESVVHYAFKKFSSLGVLIGDCSISEVTEILRWIDQTNDQRNGDELNTPGLQTMISHSFFDFWFEQLLLLGHVSLSQHNFVLILIFLLSLELGNICRNSPAYQHKWNELDQVSQVEPPIEIEDQDDEIHQNVEIQRKAIKQVPHLLERKSLVHWAESYPIF